VKFYLGVHEPAWLRRTSVPLFISRRRLARLQSLPVAAGAWALDSGGFTEVTKHGGWSVSASAYAREVLHYQREIGGMTWAAPQDWMVEPFALEATGLTIRDHQRLTVENFHQLRTLLGGLVVPVVQGWVGDDYLRHVDAYDHAGYDLTTERLVGIGSICRKGVDSDVVRIIDLVARQGVSVHAFGVRTRAMQRAADVLTSCDSQAWSRDARWAAAHGYRGECGKPTCQNCLHAALTWRDEQVGRLTHERLELWA
jgi:hypothetical protein